MKLIPKHQLEKKIYDDEIIALNQTDPNTGERNPFYNRIEDTYGTIELPKVDITEHWTPEGLRNSATKQGRQYMYDALQQGYNIIGPILSTLVSAPMDFGAIKLIGEGSKELFNIAGKTYTKIFPMKYTTARSVYIKPLHKQLVANAYNEASDLVLDTYLPGGKWYQRQLANGIPEEEILNIAREYIQNLEGVRPNPISLKGANVAESSQTGLHSSNLNFDSSNLTSLEKAKEAIVHEFGHASQSNVMPKTSKIYSEYPSYKILADANPYSLLAIEYNLTIMPKLKRKIQWQSEWDLNLKNHLSNINNVLEVRQRAFTSEILPSTTNELQLKELYKPKSLQNFKIYFK